MKKSLYGLVKFKFSSKNIGIVGSGQMGTGIAYVFGRVAKQNVLIYDTNSIQLQKSSKFIQTLLSLNLIYDL